jgi:hypothetical protein
MNNLARNFPINSTRTAAQAAGIDGAADHQLSTHSALTAPLRRNPPPPILVDR